MKRGIGKETPQARNLSRRENPEWGYGALLVGLK